MPCSFYILLCFLYLISTWTREKSFWKLSSWLCQKSRMLWATYLPLSKDKKKEQMITKFLKYTRLWNIKSHSKFFLHFKLLKKAATYFQNSVVRFFLWKLHHSYSSICMFTIRVFESRKRPWKRSSLPNNQLYFYVPISLDKL